MTDGQCLARGTTNQPTIVIPNIMTHTVPTHKKRVETRHEPYFSFFYKPWIIRILERYAWLHYLEVDQQFVCLSFYFGFGE